MQRELCLKAILSMSLFTLMACDSVPETSATCTLPQEQNILNDDTTSDEAKECVIPEREVTANLQVNATLQDFNPEQESKMRQAIERIEIVINSQEFKRRVLNHEYLGEKTFVDNGGLSNEEVYIKIMEGSETLLPSIDEEIDVDLTLYYRNNSTVGYTYPNTSRIWVNNKFFSSFTLGKVAANVSHEWTHKIGFGHDFKKTARRAYSVPYAVGTIIQQLVDGM